MSGGALRPIQISRPIPLQVHASHQLPPSPPPPALQDTPSGPALSNRAPHAHRYLLHTSPRPEQQQQQQQQQRLLQDHRPILARTAPDPAKKITRHDELHAAILRDALAEQQQEEQQQQRLASTGGRSRSHQEPVQGSVASPLAAAHPTSARPIPPTMATSHVDQRPTMAQRTASIDSSVSSSSALAAALRPSGSGASRGPQQDPASLPSAGTLIAAAGSAEAALHKLLAEHRSVTTQNTQLWRMLDKHKAALATVRQDLDKITKDRDRYKRKFKESSAQAASTTATLPATSSRIADPPVRDDSQSPLLADSTGAQHPRSLALRDLSQDTRKTSDTSDVGSVGLGRSDTPQDAANLSSSGLPGTPQSAGSSSGVRELDRAFAASVQPAAAPAPSDPRAALGQLQHTPTVSPQMSPKQSDPQRTPGGHQKTESTSSVPTSPPSAGAMLSSPKTRKAPPAPLKLNPKPEPYVANTIVDASDSDYEPDPDTARNDYQERGRRKTREDDDREREKSRQEEEEYRSRSKKDKKSKGGPSTEQIPAIAPGVLQADRRPEAQIAAPIFAATANPADIVRNRATSDLHRSNTTPSLLSPGLPMSPRPGDRPMNSPMPRALNGIPMSPKPGMTGLPLSPRAPRHAIPIPPQTPLGIMSPHLDRAMAYRQQPQINTVVSSAQADAYKDSSPQSPDLTRPSMSSEPGEIFTGLSDGSTLLPPNALASIFAKTASPRMKPSRNSMISARGSDDNPVFTIGVYDRHERKQLWRVEKTYDSLVAFDKQIKAHVNLVGFPDKALFSGHAPAKIDARRQAIDRYLYRVLELARDERSAIVVCNFLTENAIGVDRRASINGSVDLRTERAETPEQRLRQNLSGYLTKRGKNFGGWKARYFVLDGPNLKYFEGPGGAQLGTIKLQNAQIGKQSSNASASAEDEENQYRHAFLILEPKKKDSNSLVRHVLCAESDEERDTWVDSLLQYVDFREDEESLRPGLQAQASKSELSGSRSPRLQKSLTDLRPSSAATVTREKGPSLRGYSYGETVAGDAPTMGPPLSPRLGGPPSPDSDKTDVHPSISAPTNLQVISNTSDWGMRPPPPTPGAKEKKRSVFQLPFSSRGRSSSDLAPSERNHVGADRPSTAVRAVFGVELAHAVEFARPAGVMTDLPAVVYRCIEYLTAKNAIAEEGIFRLSGSANVIKALKERFNNEGDVNLMTDPNNYDIHAVAGLLKMFLRELPVSVLTRELHIEFLSALELSTLEEKVVAVNVLVNKLPVINRALIEALSAFMLLIVNNAAVNRMNVRNLGVVFSPTLNLPGPLISLFVEEQHVIFGQAYDEAESPIASHDHSAVPSDLRSPRKQMFSDLPTPAYNQTHFQPMYNGGDDTGMIPMHPSYGAYQMAPQGEGGFGSLNDALRSPSVFNSSVNGGPTPRDVKARRRESGMLAVNNHMGPTKKSSLTQLRENTAGTSY